jgi:hypothetical protein
MCTSVGKIVGYTFPVHKINGVPIARHGDLVLCKCPQRPKVLVGGTFWMVADEVGNAGMNESQTHARLHGARGDCDAFDRHAQLLDPLTEEPLAGERYRLTWSGGIIEGITSASGRTQRIQSDQGETAQLEILREDAK